MCASRASLPPIFERDFKGFGRIVKIFVGVQEKSCVTLCGCIRRSSVSMLLALRVHSFFLLEICHASVSDFRKFSSIFDAGFVSHSGTCFSEIMPSPAIV